MRTKSIYLSFSILTQLFFLFRIALIFILFSSSQWKQSDEYVLVSTSPKPVGYLVLKIFKIQPNNTKTIITTRVITEDDVVMTFDSSRYFIIRGSAVGESFGLAFCSRLEAGAFNLVNADNIEASRSKKVNRVQNISKNVQFFYEESGEAVPLQANGFRMGRERYKQFRYRKQIERERGRATWSENEEKEVRKWIQKSKKRKLSKRQSKVPNEDKGYETDKEDKQCLQKFSTNVSSAKEN
jgi:hypothetical protein